MRSLIIKTGMIILLTLPGLSAGADMSRISQAETKDTKSPTAQAETEDSKITTAQTEDMSRISKTDIVSAQSAEH